MGSPGNWSAADSVDNDRHAFGDGLTADIGRAPAGAVGDWSVVGTYRRLRPLAVTFDDHAWGRLLPAALNSRNRRCQPMPASSELLAADLLALPCEGLGLRCESSFDPIKVVVDTIRTP